VPNINVLFLTCCPNLSKYLLNHSSQTVCNLTAVIAASVVETTHRPSLHQQHFLVHEQTFYTKHVLLVLKNTCHHILDAFPFPFPFPSGWTTSSAEAVHQLRPNAQPRHNQRIWFHIHKSISSSYELERMHNLHRIRS